MYKHLDDIVRALTVTAKPCMHSYMKTCRLTALLAGLRIIYMHVKHTCKVDIYQTIRECHYWHTFNMLVSIW